MAAPPRPAPLPRARSSAVADPAAWVERAQRAGVGLGDVRDAARRCHGCALWRRATQTVFGAGNRQPTVVLVGEQPGDAEDRAGEPFVGPAGRLLDRALSDADLPRAALYVTNAVKHFSWEPRGPQRIHKKPRPGEVRACRPWVLIEIALLRPRVVVALGATAAQALLGSTVRVLRDRGTPLPSSLAPTVLVTVHPASLLREPDEAARRAAYAQFVNDLRLARRAAAQH